MSGWFGQGSDSRVGKVWPRLRGVQIVARKERWSILARNRARFRAGTTRLKWPCGCSRLHRRHRCYRSGGHRRGPPGRVRLAPRRPTQAPARVGQLTSPRKSASISHVSRGSVFCHCRAAVSVVALAALVDQARAETRAILSAGTPARAAAAAFGTERRARVSWDRARLPLSAGNGRWPERILRSLRCGADIPGKRGFEARDGPLTAPSRASPTAARRTVWQGSPLACLALCKWVYRLIACGLRRRSLHAGPLLNLRRPLGENRRGAGLRPL